MAARVIHVGADSCHRLPVLESAGYEVDTCISVPELREALTSPRQIDAVLISEGTEGAHPEAVQVARSHCSAPIVLFRETQLNFAESPFDLVVPILISPQVWLEDIAALIARCRALRADTQALCQKSAELRRQTEAVRASFNRERLRSRREYGKKIGPPDGLITGPDPDKDK